MLNQMQMIRNIFKRETDFGLLFAKLTVLGSLGSGKACGCRAACRRWEIAPGCPVPLSQGSRQTSARSGLRRCGTEPYSDPCSDDLCGSVKKYEMNTLKKQMW